MAYSAVFTLKNGIALTATGVTLKNDAFQCTGLSGLNAIDAAGGLPTGVQNVDANNVDGDTVCRIPVAYIQSLTVT